MLASGLKWIGSLVLSVLSFSALSLCAAPALDEGSGPLQLGRYDISQAAIRYQAPGQQTALSPEQTRSLVARLYQTQLLNQADINQALGLIGSDKKGPGFMLANPYWPRYTGQDIAPPRLRHGVVAGKVQANPEGYANTAEGYQIQPDGSRLYYGQAPVHRWFSDWSHGGPAAQEVCAVRFEPDAKRYRLQSFASADAAQAAGFRISHQGHCGACSSLQDLAVYIGLPDLTDPVRLCSKRSRGRDSQIGELKTCIQEAVGFSPACAEAWAYNALHTAQNCMGTCLQAYGGGKPTGFDLLARAKGAYQVMVAESFSACPPQVPHPNPQLRQRFEADGCPASNEQTGQLNACLWCDERISGPGFKYQAARTRRNSGLGSEIPRDNDHLFELADHSRYWIP